MRAKRICVRQPDMRFCRVQVAHEYTQHGIAMGHYARKHVFVLLRMVCMTTAGRRR